MRFISPFVNSILNQNGEETQLLRLYSHLSTAADMLEPGTARMLGGVLLDIGGGSLLLGLFMLGIHCTLLWQRRIVEHTRGDILHRRADRFYFFLIKSID